ncbi:MAG: hypothetical protein IK065_04435 [Neisseriaceae bacterium]|nr:hypothetical protein [Neisseriaceae bacterium]
MTENKTDNSEKTARIVIWIIATVVELMLLYAYSMGKLNKNKDGKWFIDILIVATACGSITFAALTEALQKKWTTWKIIIVNTILAVAPSLLCYWLAYSTKGIGQLPLFAWLFMGLAYLNAPLAIIVPINTIISRIHYLYCRKNEE